MQEKKVVSYFQQPMRHEGTPRCRQVFHAATFRCQPSTGEFHARRRATAAQECFHVRHRIRMYRHLRQRYICLGMRPPWHYGISFSLPQYASQALQMFSFFSLLSFSCFLHGFIFFCRRHETRTPSAITRYQSSPSPSGETRQARLLSFIPYAEDARFSQRTWCDTQAIPPPDMPKMPAEAPKEHVTKISENTDCRGR